MRALTLCLSIACATCMAGCQLKGAQFIALVGHTFPRGSRSTLVSDSGSAAGAGNKWGGAGAESGSVTSFRGEEIEGELGVTVGVMVPFGAVAEVTVPNLDQAVARAVEVALSTVLASDVPTEVSYPTGATQEPEDQESGKPNDPDPDRRGLLGANLESGEIYVGSGGTVEQYVGIALILFAFGWAVLAWRYKRVAVWKGKKPPPSDTTTETGPPPQ